MAPLRILSFILLLIATSAQTPIYMYNFCQNSTAENSPSTSYQTNVKNVLSWVTADSATSKGYNRTTIGGGGNMNNNNGTDDAVYGFYDCRGDIIGYLCQFCLTTAANEIAQRCPNSVTAVIWYDGCIIRYSNQSFYGKVDLSGIWNMTGSKSINDSTEIKKVEDSVENLIRKATMETNKSWAMDEYDWDYNEKRYGLAQCSRDLANDQCRQCLQGLLDVFPQCCGTKVAWAVISPSCGIRFDDYMFYQSTNQTGSSPMPNPGNIANSCLVWIPLY
ncbi:hypothetical protein VNO77_39269 [Canavalia gladiata]|uniref:Gnk2-homologous domain-containing protein n=1 Tax=Canavalia gladiata TaxID=3824 RepID=A0AAN9PVN5_CANGL